jgi:hypothetical protein
MGFWTVRTFTAAEIAAIQRDIQKRNQQLAEDLNTDIGRTLFQGGLLIQGRTQEKTIEKEHVVTGSLLRSWNTQLEPRSAASRIFIGRAGGAPTVGTTEPVSVLVGSFMFYAPFVENLPDGGMLNEAAEERFDDVVDLMAERGLQPALKRWARP